MRASLILLSAVACGGPDGPEGTAGDDDDDDVALPTDTGGPACGPDSGFDVVDLGVQVMDPSVVGATVRVTLSAEAGAHVACTLTSAPDAWRQLVSFASTWSFLGDGTPPGAGWETPTFDDGAWPSGAAPLGIGDPVATLLEVGATGPPDAAYFRQSFELDDPSGIAELEAMVRRDDGLAIYLNGTEVLRDNLPAGPLTPTTSAVDRVSGTDERQLITAGLDPSALVPGTNWITVELHQAIPSSDAGFDLRLTARMPAPADAPGEVHLVESDPAEVHDLQLLGLLADATYRCSAHSACGGASMSFDLDTEPLPMSPPPMARHAGAPDPAWGAYTLFNHQRACDDDAERHSLFIVDPEGRARWHYELQGVRGTSTMDIESAWLGDGQILWGGGDAEDGVPEVVHLDHTVVHRAEYPDVDDDSYHHDLAWVDGEILGLVGSAVTDGSSVWTGFSLVQHDPETQQVTWRWDSQQAYDAGQLPVDGSWDPYHANSLASVVDADGEGVYVTLLSTSQIIRVDRATGDVTWTLGRGGDFTLMSADGTPLPDEYWFDGMHAVDVFDDRLMLYENGYGDLQSEVLELTLDVEARVATLSWNWTEFGWFEPVWGDADELPGGDILVAMAHAWCIGGNADHLGALVEVHRDTKTVGWRVDFLDPDDATYRAERLDGCALFSNSRYCPDVAARLDALGL